jgi:threonine dehydrogenase-like Zn-dependent dehydrogenase
MGILDADGAFAEYVRVPIANLHLVPESVSDESAVFAEPLAAAFEILEQVDLAAGSDCLVLGDGKLGLLIAQVLHGAGARVRIVGKHPEKLAIASRLGIEAILRDDHRPEPVSLVVEATGRSDGFDCAVAAVKPRGTIVLKTTVAARAEIDLAPLVINEVQVVGSRCGPFPPAMRALENGSVDVGSLIQERVRLADGLEALRIAAMPGALKVLIEVG